MFHYFFIGKKKKLQYTVNLLDNIFWIAKYSLTKFDVN